MKDKDTEAFTSMAMDIAKLANAIEEQSRRIDEEMEEMEGGILTIDRETGRLNGNSEEQANAHLSLCKRVDGLHEAISQIKGLQAEADTKLRQAVYGLRIDLSRTSSKIDSLAVEIAALRRK